MTKWVMIGVILLAGCPSETQSTTCSPDQDVDNGRCISRPTYDHTPAPPMPPLERQEAISEVTSVAGLRVEAFPAGAAGWSILIENQTDASMSVLWDESSFVTSEGDAEGRLINGNTRKIDVAKAQPPEPIAPHAHVKDLVLAEKLVEAEENEATALRIQEQYGPQRKLNASITRARAARHQMLVGGKLYVVVNTSTGKQTWAGTVSEGNEK